MNEHQVKRWERRRAIAQSLVEDMSSEMLLHTIDCATCGSDDEDEVCTTGLGIRTVVDVAKELLAEIIENEGPVQ